MNIIGVIPARYASTRFPGKPLVPIAGVPLLLRVIQRCRLAKSLSDLVVATDDLRIAEFARQHARVEMTRSDHPSGTDRIAEVANRLRADAYINVQGDEPLMEPHIIDGVAGLLEKFPMTTAASPIRERHEIESPSIVKVVVGQNQQAIYFSRHPIPYLRDWEKELFSEKIHRFPFLKHLGIYGYRRDCLLGLVSHSPTPLELAEKLEQLRALESGFAIGVTTIEHAGFGVDTPEDVERIERLLAQP